MDMNIKLFKNNNTSKELSVKIFMVIFSTIIIGISIAFLKISLFGADPFQCFVAGVFNKVNIGFGNLYIIINIILLCCMFVVARELVGIGTFINMFFLGHIIEYSLEFLGVAFPVMTLSLRISSLIFGLILLCFAVAIYFTANLGVSTYDFIAIKLVDVIKLKFKYCRVITDGICIVVGVCLGAEIGREIGIGTILTAFFMGPLIEFFKLKVVEPIFNRVIN